MDKRIKDTSLRLSEYNSIPLEYCESCLSLRILEASEVPYCDDCGSTSIGALPVMDWVLLKKGRGESDYIE